MGQNKNKAVQLQENASKISKVPRGHAFRPPRGAHLRWAHCQFITHTPRPPPSKILDPRLNAPSYPTNLDRPITTYLWHPHVLINALGLIKDVFITCTYIINGLLQCSRKSLRPKQHSGLTTVFLFRVSWTLQFYQCLSLRMPKVRWNKMWRNI